MVGPKKQDFWPKINILKGNHCILRIRGVTVCQKLDMILENEVVQKLKLEKNVFLQKRSPKLIFLNIYTYIYIFFFKFFSFLTYKIDVKSQIMSLFDYFYLQNTYQQ